MKTMILIVAAGMSAALSAAPTLTGVKVTQPRAGVVKVDYTLGGEDAIVTVDFLTNGVSIGERNFTRLEGDVNGKVAVGGRSLTWKARKDWPGHEEKVTAKVRAWALANPPDYMVVDLDGATKGAVRYYVSTNALPEGGLANDVYRLTKLVLRKIPARGVVWAMGTTQREEESFRAQTARTGESFANERLHAVSLSHDYFMAIYPTTQQQYMKIMGTTKDPAHFQRAQYGSDDYLMGPVETVAYDTYRGGDWPTEREPAADTMVAKLRGFTGMDFDLPTETQWEYACRAGAATWRPWGDSIDATRLNYNMNVKNEKKDDANFSYRTSKVNDYPPQNAWGLYDMLGNVEEMCLDRYSSSLPADFAKGAPVIDPEGPTTGTSVVTRGGGCLHGGERNRSGWRRDSGTSVTQTRGVVGVRLCCVIGK